MEAANAYAPEFMAYYNARFGREPQSSHNAHRPLLGPGPRRHPRRQKERDTHKLATSELAPVVSRRALDVCAEITQLFAPERDITA
jgi:hypothetical protein